MGSSAFERGAATEQEKIAEWHKKHDICKKAIEEKLQVIQLILEPHFSPHAHKFQIIKTGTSILIKVINDKYSEDSFAIYPNIEWDDNRGECLHSAEGYCVASCAGFENNCDGDRLLELAGAYFVRKGG